MKLKEIVMCAVAAAIACGCGLQKLAAENAAKAEAENRAASKIIVTGTDHIPGRNFEILGPVSSANQACFTPLAFAKASRKQYPGTDAVVAFRTSKGECISAFGGEMCGTRCEGTAVHFTGGIAETGR